MLVSGELTAVLDLALLVAGWMMKGGTPEVREVRATCVGTARYCWGRGGQFS